MMIVRNLKQLKKCIKEKGKKIKKRKDEIEEWK